MNKEFPQDCRDKLKDDVEDTQNLEQTELFKKCDKKFALSAYQAIVFKRESDRFYKAKDSHIIYKLDGGLEKVGPRNLPFVSQIANPIWQFHNSVSHTSGGEGNLTLIGVKDIKEYLFDMPESTYEKYFGHEVGSKDLLVENLPNKGHCLYGRHIENGYISPVLAIVKYDPNKKGYTPEESKSFAACVVLSLPYYMGANDVYAYREHLVRRGSSKRYGSAYFLFWRYPTNVFLTNDLMSTDTDFQQFSKQLLEAYEKVSK
ncbi:hypothetical protein [Emcibacter sp.]|uniref:hypothetical protein n=1 Tax=Emcibacter sp. TaxID=1979954 RepID=UPI003A95DD3E